jgi:hypothetical protein
LEQVKGVSANLPAEDVSTTGLAGKMLTGELSPLLDVLSKTLISQSVMLDLPWALWQR